MQATVSVSVTGSLHVLRDGDHQSQVFMGAQACRQDVQQCLTAVAWMLDKGVTGWSYDQNVPLATKKLITDAATELGSVPPVWKVPSSSPLKELNNMAAELAAMR